MMVGHAILLWLQRSKFKYFEILAAVSEALLAEEDRPFGNALNEASDQEHDGK